MDRKKSGSRSQWLKRLVEFCAAFDVTVKLAYYPPYHSKYNSIERVFGVLENFWNGDPLRTTAKALGLAEGMTYKAHIYHFNSFRASIHRSEIRYFTNLSKQGTPLFIIVLKTW